ncbi:GTP-binding protein LepA [Pneumocystis carinii B80]|uniref:GTP-binding protein LepA n=1 Tax=Pneumocystis carinii (strain B80) TaxID=1408658 RepID=A0A0W4ZBW7_PNEC8|nr:GTP-binding protein LepA [Pneumocystis carinii B80]KTW25852.1 GTP-binding protein LepA [Pneumocystis carinii B80]
MKYKELGDYCTYKPWKVNMLLEITGTISESWRNRQVLDKLKVERERGITVKAQVCSMLYDYRGETYLLNLIDTPGHVDFRTEVDHSLAVCDGCLLLVDASQGIQSQTVANYQLALSRRLVILPVLNKIDMPNSEPEKILSQLKQTFNIVPEDVMFVSAKKGTGIEKIIPNIVDKIPPPKGSLMNDLKCFLIDSWYDPFDGVIILVKVYDGCLRKGDKIQSICTGLKYNVTDVGIMYPDRVSTELLKAGQVGYVILGMKNSEESYIGDTFYHVGKNVNPLPRFKEFKPTIFVGAFPVDANNFQKLNESIKHLLLNDRSVFVEKESSSALGQGWRIGFVGTLHLSVFKDRLKNEYNEEIIVTSPTVPFKLIYKNGKEKMISNPSLFPDIIDLKRDILNLEEPVAEVTMAFPFEYLGDVIELCENNRGIRKEMIFPSEENCILKYDIPMVLLIDDFFEKLKGLTKGYATLDYRIIGYKVADLVKIKLLINGSPIDALSTILHRSQINAKGKEFVRHLKSLIKKQLFEVIIQAVVENRIIARETIKPLKKAVTAKCYGGDITRKMKLLSKQKEGKKKLKDIGNVIVDHTVFQRFLEKYT